MVRFARAKGSKASNEKLPEDATPWQVMKKQMFDAKQIKVEPIKNVNEFLKKDSGNEGTTWAKFEETKPKLVKVKKEQAKKGQLSATITKKKQSIQQNDTGDKSIVKKKRKKQQNNTIDDTSVEEKKQKILQTDTIDNAEHGGNVDAELPTKFKKHSGYQRPSDTEGLEPVHMFGRNPDEGNKVGKRENFMRNNFQGNFARNQNKGSFQGSGRFKSFNQKQMQGHPHERRKPQKDIFTIKVGSRTLELRYYDRFPVKIEDWERLTELEKKLKEENIPKEQILATMKLERRRAEKALTRERKKVCFHCREAGHMLSDCPLIEESQFGNKDSTVPDSAASGMCFKCGSLEHTHFECKVIKGDIYKFAKCFVCQEQGHLSRQCPDNPRGLYPKGGGCSECGDVTHFRRDCPKYQKEKQGTALTVPTLKEDDALEALEDDSEKTTQQMPNTKSKPKKKVVKF